MSLRKPRYTGDPRVEGGKVFCNYCDVDLGTCVVCYPGGVIAPACNGCAEDIMAKGDKVTPILPSIYLCQQGEKKVIVTMAQSSQGAS